MDERQKIEANILADYIVISTDLNLFNISNYKIP